MQADWSVEEADGITAVLAGCTHRFIADGGELVCTTCGLSAPIYAGPSPSLDSSESVHRIHPGTRGLGTQLNVANCRAILRPGLRAEGKSADVAKRAIRLYREQIPRGDSVLEGVLSDVWEELKATMPRGDVTDYAARLAVEEVKKFRREYPDLNPKGLRAQLAKRVVARLALLEDGGQ